MTKLEPEAEKRLRAKISEQLQEQALRKAREGASDSNRHEIEVIERQANASVIRKQNEINSLEQKLGEKDAELKLLYKKVAQLQNAAAA